MDKKPGRPAPPAAKHAPVNKSLESLLWGIGVPFTANIVQIELVEEIFEY
jgi:hypothetical protein